VVHPQRAVPTDAREVKCVGGLAFRDIPGAVGPDENEGYPAPVWPLQCRESVADRFEADLEAPGQLVDVVPQRLGGGQELSVGE
jgi:hypothetical protein